MEYGRGATAVLHRALPSSGSLSLLGDLLNGEDGEVVRVDAGAPIRTLLLSAIPYDDFVVEHIEDAGGHFRLAALQQQIEFFVQFAFSVHAANGR